MNNHKYDPNNPYNLSKKERLRIHKEIQQELKEKPRNNYSNCNTLKLIIITAIIYIFLFLIGTGTLK